MSSEKPLNPADVRRAGMDLLARREHSGEELLKKLKRRFGRHPDATEVIQRELDRLVDEGLLSDTRYAASLVRQLIARGLGPRRLDQELRTKGVRSTWDACIDPEEGEIDWFAQAETVYSRKFERQLWPEERDARRKEWAKRARFMQYRGFDPEHFMHLLDSSDCHDG